MKKLLSFALSALLLIAVAVPVFASEKESSKTSAPRAAICMQCYSGTVVPFSERIETSNKYNRDCVHMQFGHDTWRTVFVTTGTRCNYCNIRYSENTVSQENLAGCYGYNIKP